MITSFFAPKIEIGKDKEKRSRDVIEQSEEEGKGNKKPKLSIVDEMISHLKDDGDEENYSWRRSMDQHMSSPAFLKLAKYVAGERNSKKTIYPPPADSFTALNWTPLQEVKVVIVGQDPYHGPNQAHGLCFSVRKGIDIPPSLKNIYKELANDTDIQFPNKRGMPRHGYLERWAKQGVLLLNTVLTVRSGEANSHRKKGWEIFTDQVIRVLVKENKKGLVFLLWGNSATEKATNILGGNSRKHTVIKTSHPSPLGASKTKSPFLGSKCFSRANKALVEYGYDPVDWNVDDE
eukprot:CAMPEP_0194205684 /NCGR_PEP_ID=MMETSP0156-20130528/4908_1 /TAXON_ID=33649 /ORGANISM="Thalassionema nitzschioides, Strain L26-B" /LENGTH=290 /DNA_ID=CAMNT_0038932029 /DNA_START=68 /DNA_END=940 /DNA_ORIENTATION=-